MILNKRKRVLNMYGMFQSRIPHNLRVLLGHRFDIPKIDMILIFGEH